MSAHTGRLKFGKFGLAEDPRGQHVLMPNGTLREVYDFYRREFPAAYMLKVRSFNREIVEEIVAEAAQILDRSWEG